MDSGSGDSANESGSGAIFYDDLEQPTEIFGFGYPSIFQGFWSSSEGI